MQIGIYAGSFDPISNGHVDIIIRAAKLVEKLYVLVTENVEKKAVFTPDERIDMIKKAINLSNVVVDKTADLVVRYAQKKGATVVFRGLRNIKDFESEIALYHYNKNLNPNIETIVLFPSHRLTYLSSSAIKELVYYNADISKYVPKNLVKTITEGIKKSFN